MAAKKNSCKIAVLVLLVLLSAINLFAAQHALIIKDNADLLSDEEELQLQEVMKPILEYGGVAFITNKDGYSGSANNLAYSYCKSFFDKRSGIVFLIDMHDRRIEFYSMGKIYDVIGEMWANVIADNIYKHATDGEYFICAQKGFTQLATVLNGGKVAAPMRYVSFILLSIAMTLLVMYYRLYKSRKKAHFGKKVNLLTEVTEKKLTIDVLEKKKTWEESITHSSSGGHRGSSGGGRSGGGGGHGF